jgi:hypothetical protein
MSSSPSVRQRTPRPLSVRELVTFDKLREPPGDRPPAWQEVPCRDQGVAPRHADRLGRRSAGRGARRDIAALPGRRE